MQGTNIVTDISPLKEEVSSTAQVLRLLADQVEKKETGIDFFLVTLDTEQNFGISYDFDQNGYWSLVGALNVAKDKLQQGD
jgi:hypothetical protein